MNVTNKPSASFWKSLLNEIFSPQGTTAARGVSQPLWGENDNVTGQLPQTQNLFGNDAFENTTQPQVPSAAVDSLETATPKHPWMDTLANSSNLRGGRTGTCVATTLGNMDRLGIPAGFTGGTSADPNNPRGAMVQMLRGGKWKPLDVAGSRQQTIRSPYGTATASVMDRATYQAAVKAGKIPAGAVVFQSRHGWDYSGGSSGNDMGVVQRNGNVFNYANMGSPLVYGAATKEIVVMVPK
jgi:hypothetical protein